MLYFECNEGNEVEHVLCMVNECSLERVFSGTYAVAQHLKNNHGVFEKVLSSDDEPMFGSEEEKAKIRNKKTNNHLMHFIVTGFLPFSIIENTYFKK